MGCIKLRVNSLLTLPQSRLILSGVRKEKGFAVYSRQFTPWQYDTRDLWLKMSAGEKIVISLYGVEVEILTLVGQGSAKDQELCTVVTEEEIGIILEKAKLHKQRWKKYYMNARDTRW